MGAMLDAANTPPRPEEKVLDRLRQLWDVTVQPNGASVFEMLLEVRITALSEGRPDDVSHLLTAREFGCRDLRERIARTVGVGQWDDVGAALDGSPDAAALVYGVVQTVILRCILGCIDEPEIEAGGCHALVAVLRIPAPRRSRPVVIDGLSEAVSGAVDPRRPNAPIRRRLAVEVEGLPVDSLAPPRYPLGLDFPTWSLLRAYEPDWLLPGAQTVPRRHDHRAADQPGVHRRVPGRPEHAVSRRSALAGPPRRPVGHAAAHVLRSGRSAHGYANPRCHPHRRLAGCVRARRPRPPADSARRR